MQTSTNSIERLLGLFKSQPTTRLELSIFIARALNTLGEPIPSTVVNELIKNINKSREALIEVSVNSTNIEHLKRNYLWLKADTIKRNIPPSMLDFAPFLRVMPEAERHQAERRLANIPLASFGNVFLIARVRQALESLSIPRQRIGPSLQDFMSVSSGRDLRAACRLLEQTAGASDDLLTTLYLSTSKIPEMQLRAVALIQNKSLRNLFLIKLDQLLDTKESKTQKNTHLKTINAVLNEQPKNAWLKLKKLRICLSLGTKLGDLTFVQTLEELISSDLNPSLNRQLFLICVEGRKKEEALLLSARLLSLDNTSKNKLWIYNQLQIFGAIPNELKDQLSIFDEPNAINRQDALILDPGYSFQAGHHENSNLAVFEILQSSQHSRVTLICSLNARVSTEVNSLMNVSKTLWTNPYAHNGKQWSARDIEGLNEAFYQDLKQNLVVIPSIIYIHSILLSMLLCFESGFQKCRLNDN